MWLVHALPDERFCPEIVKKIVGLYFDGQKMALLPPCFPQKSPFRRFLMALRIFVRLSSFNALKIEICEGLFPGALVRFFSRLFVLPAIVS